MTVSKVRGYRAMIGYTQDQMSAIFGISKQSYSNKERGITSFTREEMLKMKELVNKVVPTATIDDIFFS